MDMRRASTRHPNDHPQPLSSIAALPDPLTVHHPVPPQQSSLFYNISQAAYPILSTTDTLQDPTTPVVNTWNPTPELISHLIQHFNLLPHLGSLPDNGSSSPSPSLPSASAAQSEQLSFLHTSSTRHTSDSQAVAEDPRLADPSSSASATACTMEPQDNKWPTFIKLVQQVPPQSRTFYKNAPFLFHRQGSTGAASSSSPTTDSVGCFSPRLKTLVDPFDSERDVLSKIYILTTADFEGDIITTALDDSPAQHQQLPSLKYLLKVFPDRTPFKHVATTSAAARVDIKSKPSREREFMKQVVQDAIEHEIGALAWVDQYLSLTQTLKLVGYAYKRCGGKSASDTSGLEAYGILGFILMEFPDDGYLYQAPTEEYPARESQQIEMSERLAEMLFEMRSARSSKVTGFSIQTGSTAADGSTVVGNKLTRPYSRFDLIVDALRRKDAEKTEKEYLHTSSSPSVSSLAEVGPGEPPLQPKATTCTNNNDPHCQLGLSAAAAASAGRWSDITVISQSSSSLPVSCPASFTMTLMQGESQSSSLSRQLQIKEVECHRVTYGDIQNLCSQETSTPTATSVPVTTAAAEAVTLLKDTLSSIVEAPIIHNQDHQIQVASQDDFLTCIAKRLVNAPHPPRDALEACKRLSQGQQQQTELQQKVGFAKIDNLAKGTVQHLDIERTKATVRPVSTVVGASAIDAYVYPILPAFGSSATTAAATESLPKTSPLSSTSPISPTSPCTLQRRSKQANQLSSIFDSDPSVYCSAHAQANHLDGRGEIRHLQTAIPFTSDTTGISPLSSAITWPMEFVEPKGRSNEGQPIYSSVAEYEHVRIINSLVALERLDSTLGSRSRFPRELLTLLPRVLHLAHKSDVLFARPSVEGGHAREAALHLPGLFDGIDAVFTHSQISTQPSLVTDRQRRGILAVTNFQRAGFLPPYDEDIRSLFVKRVYSSFWNVPTADEDNNDDDDDDDNDDDEGIASVGEGCAQEQGGDDGRIKNQSRTCKTVGRAWSFKRSYKMPGPTTTGPTATVTEDEEENEDNEAKDIILAGSITIHGQHPLPYPLLNHAIEHGTSCGSRYMVLVDANHSPTTSFVTESSSSADQKRFSNSLTGSVGCHDTTAASEGVPLSIPRAVESVFSGESESLKKNSGSFSRMRSLFKAQFHLKSKKDKRKEGDGHRDHDPHPLEIEQLNGNHLDSNELFFMSPLTPPALTATAAVASWPPSPIFTRAGQAEKRPPQIPPFSFMTDIPIFHAAPSSLSLSLSINSTRSTVSLATLLPEASEVCQVGWSRFLKTFCKLETRALDPFHQQQQHYDAYDSTTTLPTTALPPTTATNPSQVLESLISIIKTLQNLVIALEAGGIVLTPDQLLTSISKRQQIWRQREDERIGRIESGKQALKNMRVLAGDRQEAEQRDSRLVGFTQAQQVGIQGQVQQAHGQGDEVQTIPPKVPPKDDCPPAVPPKDHEESIRVIATDSAGVGARIHHSTKTKPLLFFPMRTCANHSRSLSNCSDNNSGAAAYTIRSPDDDILYSAPGLQRDPIPSELPDHILVTDPTLSSSPPMTDAFNGCSTNPSNTAMLMNQSLPTTSPVAATAIYEAKNLQHKLGTMIAPTLPVYGLRLTSQDGTKTLAQVETERVEREMRAFWKELEALCEPNDSLHPLSHSLPSHHRRASPPCLLRVASPPPGIVLLSLTELETHVDLVERYVAEMEARSSLPPSYSS